MVQQVYRLLASDVVWDDLFQAPSVAVLDQEGVRQVTVPSSHFLAVPDALITIKAMTLILDRITNSGSTSTAGRPACTARTSRRPPRCRTAPAAPRRSLTAGTTLNTVTTSSSLVFQVTIFNGGTSQEVQIPVTLTIDRPASQGGPITKNEKVQLVDPGTVRVGHVQRPRPGAVRVSDARFTSTSRRCPARRTRRTTPPSTT